MKCCERDESLGLIRLFIVGERRQRRLEPKREREREREREEEREKEREKKKFKKKKTNFVPASRASSPLEFSGEMEARPFLFDLSVDRLNSIYHFN